MKIQKSKNRFALGIQKTVLVLTILLSFTTFAQEKKGKNQEKRTPEEKVQMQVARLTKELNLSEKQIAQVQLLTEKRVSNRDGFKEKKEEIKKANKEEKEALRATMKKEQEIAKAEMKAILTAEQYTKWESNLEDRKEKMMEKRADKKKSKR